MQVWKQHAASDICVLSRTYPPIHPSCASLVCNPLVSCPCTYFFCCRHSHSGIIWCDTGSTSIQTCSLPAAVSISLSTMLMLCPYQLSGSVDPGLAGSLHRKMLTPTPAGEACCAMASNCEMLGCYISNRAW